MDGKLVIDNWTRQRRGDTFFGTGSREEKGVYHLKANTAHSIFVEFSNVRGPADGDEDENIHTSVFFNSLALHSSRNLTKSPIVGLVYASEAQKSLTQML